MPMATSRPKTPVQAPTGYHIGSQAEDVREGDGRGDDGSADHGGPVELRKPATAVGAFEQRAGEPEGEHAEDDGEDAGVYERVGGELPDLPVDDSQRLSTRGCRAGCRARMTAIPGSPSPKKAATLSRISLRVAPLKGGSDNVVGLERGILTESPRTISP